MHIRPVVKRLSPEASQRVFKSRLYHCHLLALVITHSLSKFLQMDFAENLRAVRISYMETSKLKSMLNTCFALL